MPRVIHLSCIAAIFVLTLGSGACAEEHAVSTAQNVEPYNRGVKEADAGHWREAAAAFSEAIRADPKDGDAHFKLASVYEQLKRYPEAVKEYEEAIRCKPDDGEANLGLGYVENDLGNTSDAIVPLKRAVLLLPDRVEPLDELALSYQTLKQFPEAIAAYRQSIRLQPGAAVTHYRLGWTYNGMGRYTDAIESLDEAVRLKPDYVEAHSERGYAYRGLQRNEEAAEAYQRAIAIDPKFAPARHGLSLSYQALGNTAGASEQQGILSTLDPNWATKDWPAPRSTPQSPPGPTADSTGGTLVPRVSRATISGNVTSSNGTHLSDVRVLLSGSANAETFTDASGSYSFDNLVVNGASYSVRPVRSDSEFKPAFRDFNPISQSETVNFIARGGTADSVVAAQSGSNYELIPNPQLEAQTGRLIFSFTDRDASGGATISPGNQFVFFDNEVPLAPGAYDVTINGAVLIGVPIQQGRDTSIKVGVLKLSVAADIFDQAKTKELMFASAGKLALPVGIYNVNVNGEFKRVVIRDKQVTEF